MSTTDSTTAGTRDERRDKYTERQRDAYLFLFILQESGVTNMFGGWTYLLTEFPDMSRDDAQDLLKTWMRDYRAIRADLYE